jgi:hypothetical protein
VNLAKAINDVVLENEMLFAEVTNLRRRCAEAENTRSILEVDIRGLQELLEGARADQQRLKEQITERDEEIAVLRDEKEKVAVTVLAFQERMAAMTQQREDQQRSPTPPPTAKRGSTLQGKEAGAGGTNPLNLLKDLNALKIFAAQMSASIRRLTLAGKPREDFVVSIAHNKAIIEKLKSSASWNTPGDASPSGSETSLAAASSGSCPERDAATAMVKDLILAACQVINELLDTVWEVMPGAGQGAAAVPQTPWSGGWLGLTQGG